MNAQGNAETMTNFKRHSGERIKRLKATGEPLFLTIKGKTEVVVQDAESYQRLLNAFEQAEAVAGIKRGLESLERGAGIPLATAVASLRKKHGIVKAS